MKRFTSMAILVIATIAILPAVGFDVNSQSVNSAVLSADGLGSPMPPGPYVLLADGLGSPMPPGPYALA